MTSLLLIISFLIHVVVLIALFQLYQQNQRIMQERDDTLHTKMQQFIDEIKQENDYLQQQLSQRKSATAVSNLQQNVQKSENQVNASTRHNPADQHPINNKTTAKHSITNLTEDRKEEMELSLEGKILQLHEVGFEAAEIAEQLTCGKTEVELILNLQQQLKQNS